MSTYRELVYLTLDELKMTSDDSHFRIEHIIFLLDKYRTFVLKQRYKDVRKIIPLSNYQTVNITLNQSAPVANESVCKSYLKSNELIPDIINISIPRLSSIDFFSSNFTYVSNERFPYVGLSKYLQHEIYCTLSPDNHLYMKSNNPQAYSISSMRMTAVFENSSEASNLSEENTKELLDRKFPIEESLISTLIEFVVKELSGYKYQAKDIFNNATDDLSALPTSTPQSNGAQNTQNQ